MKSAVSRPLSLLLVLASTQFSFQSALSAPAKTAAPGKAVMRESLKPIDQAKMDTTSVTSTARKTGEGLHADVTREALAGLFSASNLKVIIDANVAQDSGEGAEEARRHFGKEAIQATLSYIDREKKTALNYAAEADTDARSRARALQHFGLMLHAVQDYYTKSNYVELQMESPANRADPFNTPLVEWAKASSGYTGSSSGNAITSAKFGSTDDDLDKENPESVGGKKKLGGTSAYAVARDLSIRETQRQWSMFEALIRNRCNDRAPAVIASLKQGTLDLSEEE